MNWYTQQFLPFRHWAQQRWPDMRWGLVVRGNSYEILGPIIKLVADADNDN